MKSIIIAGAMFAVQVPEGAVLGTMLQIQSPTGTMLNVQVPQGVMPGGTFQVQDPSSQPQVVVAQVAPVAQPQGWWPGMPAGQYQPGGQAGATTYGGQQPAQQAMPTLMAAQMAGLPKPAQNMMGQAMAMMGAPAQMMMGAPGAVAPAAGSFPVQVPAGAGPVTTVQITSPNGRLMQVQIPPGYPPGSTFMVQDGPPQPVQVDPFKLVGSIPSVHIEEKMNLLETAAGLLGELMGVDLELEMATKYLVKTPQGHPLFFAIEQTDFCQRQFGGECRGTDVDVVVLGQDPALMQEATGQFDWSFNPLKKVDLTGSQKFFHMHKDCQFTCCCFNRPVIDVINGTNGELIGKISDPWVCCDLTFGLQDRQGNVVMEAKGGCCQPGMWCPFPCGPCREVRFIVTDAKSGEEVGNLKKVVPDCLKFIAADDVDNYEVEFGNVSNPEWRAMLIALGLFIDYRYFNTRSDKNHQDGDSWSGGGSDHGDHGDEGGGDEGGGDEGGGE